MSTKDSVIIATDSKFRTGFIDRRQGEEDTYRDSIWMGCKIFPINNMVFALSGFNYESIVSIAKKVCLKSKNVQEAVTLFEAEAKISYQNYLNNIKQNFPYLFNKNLNQYGANVLFAAYENDSFNISYVHFWLDTLGENFKVVDSTSSIGTPKLPSQVTVKTFGHNSAIEPIVENPHYWLNGVINGINTLINIQQVATPEYVGGSTTIYCIKKTGNYFIQNMNKCE
jgi:hypothetical protein